MKTDDRRVQATGRALLLVLILAGAVWLFPASEQSDSPVEFASPAARPPHRPTSKRDARPDMSLPEVPAVATAPTPPRPAQWPAASVFDFANLTPPSPRTPEAEPLPTALWFTEQDLLHPELYFEAAERIPELNRPEERRDTLEFFLRYREKLVRDLEAADPQSREEIRSAVARYDNAIVRLRQLMGQSKEQP